MLTNQKNTIEEEDEMVTRLKSTKDEHEVVTRLKSTQYPLAIQDYKRGTYVGNAWAEMKATSTELKRLAKANEGEGVFEDNGKGYGPSALMLAVIKGITASQLIEIYRKPIGYSFSTQWFEMWDVSSCANYDDEVSIIFGLMAEDCSGYMMRDSFAGGFLAGALGVWDWVKDKIYPPSHVERLRTKVD